MPNDKYALTTETRVVAGVTLYRIRAKRDIGTDVKAGDLGGFIEHERNLSTEGDCWVYDDAIVMDFAWVRDEAQVRGTALVRDGARIYGAAWVFGNARVFGYAQVAGDARIFGDARVHSIAWVTDNAVVAGDARVTGNMTSDDWVFGARET